MSSFSGDLAEHSYWHVPMLKVVSVEARPFLTNEVDTSESKRLAITKDLLQDEVDNLCQLRREYIMADWRPQSHWQYWTIFAVLLNLDQEGWLRTPGETEVPLNFPDLEPSEMKKVVQTTLACHGYRRDWITKQTRDILPPAAKCPEGEEMSPPQPPPPPSPPQPLSNVEEVSPPSPQPPPPPSSDVEEISPPLHPSPKRSLPNATLDDGTPAKIRAIEVEQVSPMMPTSSARLGVQKLRVVTSVTPTKPRSMDAQPMTPTTPTPARPVTPGRRMALAVGKMARQPMCLNLADDNIEQPIRQHNGHVGTLEEYRANMRNAAALIEIGWLRMWLPLGAGGAYRIMAWAERPSEHEVVVRHLGRGPTWGGTDVMSCALDSIIIVGMFLSAWHTEIDIASTGVRSSDVQKAWKNAITYDWTLGKGQANSHIKTTFERAVKDLVTPGRVLVYGAVWNRCA